MTVTAWEKAKLLAVWVDYSEHWASNSVKTTTTLTTWSIHIHILMYTRFGVAASVLQSSLWSSQQFRQSSSRCWQDGSQAELRRRHRKQIFSAWCQTQAKTQKCRDRTRPTNVEQILLQHTQNHHSVAQAFINWVVPYTKFRDLFESMVHTNNKIADIRTDIVMFHYHQLSTPINPFVFICYFYFFYNDNKRSRASEWNNT